MDAPLVLYNHHFKKFILTDQNGIILSAVILYKEKKQKQEITITWSYLPEVTIKINHVLYHCG